MNILSLCALNVILDFNINENMENILFYEMEEKNYDSLRDIQVQFSET